MEALRRLTDLGIRCGVLVAPVLPGLSDGEEQLTEVVEACAAAGAVSINAVALHLRGTVRAHYFDWLGSARPDLVRLHRGRFRRGAYQEDEARRAGGGHRARGRPALRGDGPGPLPRPSRAAGSSRNAGGAAGVSARTGPAEARAADGGARGAEAGAERDGQQLRLL